MSVYLAFRGSRDDLQIKEMIRDVIIHHNSYTEHWHVVLSLLSSTASKYPLWGICQKQR